MVTNVKFAGPVGFAQDVTSAPHLVQACTEGAEKRADALTARRHVAHLPRPPGLAFDFGHAELVCHGRGPVLIAVVGDAGVHIAVVDHDTVSAQHAERDRSI